VTLEGRTWKATLTVCWRWFPQS